jgi:mannosyl-3-phosphoglycerate phosphatase
MIHLAEYQNKLLVFTDLDGTLLDLHTYSFQPALPALNALKKKNIPLVFCTSKTRTETERIRKRIENIHPFIVENGSAIFIPKGYFSQQFLVNPERTDYDIIELGTPYALLREALFRIQARFPGKIRGFGDLSVEEIARLCEFSLEEAALARQREYDEPFLCKDSTLIDKIRDAAKSSNLQITRGGRFYHLMGDSDKGKAVQRLIEIYRQKFPILETVALGDSINDLPMLAAVQHPILLQRPDGQYDPSIKLDGLIFAEANGPTGWRNAVAKILDMPDLS